MVAAWCLVIGMVVLHKLWRVLGQRVGDSACEGIRSVFVIFRALCVELPTEFIARVGVHFVEIPLGRHPAHVVHGRGHGGFDSGVDGCRIKGKTAETADAEDADAVFVNFVMCGEIVYRCAKVFRVDVG